MPVFTTGFESSTLLLKPIGGIGHFRVLQCSLEGRAAHSGKSGVATRVVTSEVSTADFAYNIGKAPIIQESGVKTWVRADRPGVQLLVRVILPRSIDPKTSKPLEFLIAGSSYNKVGLWEQLVLHDMPTIVQRRIRKIRSARNIPIDAKEAYCDQIVIRLRPGKGTTELFMDDFEVYGYLASPPEQKNSAAEKPRMASDLKSNAKAKSSNPIRDSTVRPAQFSEGHAHGNSSRTRAVTNAQVELLGEMLLVGGRPFFPRVLQYNGEEPAAIRELGFNTVVLDHLATTEELAGFRAARLWLICPPPTFEDSSKQALAERYSGILAWKLNGRHTASQLAVTKEYVDLIHQRDPWMGRPVVGHVSQSILAYSRVFDVLLLDGPGSLLSVTEQFETMQQRLQTARQGTACWILLASNDTERANSMESSALLAIAAGSRGLFFSSSQAVVGKLATSPKRAMQLELLNYYLSPHDTMFALAEQKTTRQRYPNTVSKLLLSDRAHLMIWVSDRLLQPQSNDKETKNNLKSILVAGVPETYSAFRWSPAGLIALKHRRAAGGIQVEFDRPMQSDLLLFSRDSRILAGLGKRAATTAKRSVVLTQQLAEMELASAQGIATKQGEPLKNSRSNITRNAAASKNQQAIETRRRYSQPNRLKAKRQLALSETFSRSGNYAAAFDAANAVRQMALAARPKYANKHAKNRQLLTSNSPLERKLQELAASATAAEDLIAAGTFDQLADVRVAGWKYIQRKQDNVTTNVQLVPVANNTKQTCLRIRVTKQNAGPLIESAVQIITPAAPAASGDLLRFSGKVRVQTKAAHCLQITDSIGGEQFAIDVGAAEVWRPFVIHRIAPKTGMVHLTISMNQPGTVWLDDLRIEKLTSPPQERSAVRKTDSAFAPPPDPR